MTEDLDTGVGMILNKLEELSISDNTYVIYMSDHGSSRNLSSNAPLNRGKGTLWEGGMRVPLIIAGPGVQPGAYCNVPVVGWDLFPTFCELAGAAQPAPKADERGLEGVSLKPLFATGKAELNRPGDQIAFHFPHYGQAGPMSTITSGNFKLIKFYDTNEVNLFNIVNDPGETKNLANNNAAQTAKLNNQLIDYLASVNAGVPTANPGFDPTATESDTGRTGRRRSGGGRGGQRQAQIQVREKELSKLLDAVKNNDHDEIGHLIQVMKTTLANAPQRPRAARTNAGDGPTPRQQRERDLQQLEETHKAANMEKLVELIGEIKARLDSGNGRQAGSENGRRRELPNVPSRTDRNDN